MSKRYGVTIRFNQEERAVLRKLMTFWNLSEKAVLQLAFEQFVTATEQLHKKLEKEGKVDEQGSNATSGGDSGAGSSASASGADEANTVAAS